MMADSFQDLQDAVIAGEGERARELTQRLLSEGVGAREILDSGLLPGMDVVGRRMRAGECFIPEVLLSARTMQGALDLLKPLLGVGETGALGTVVIGTVEGDLHDIGKNLVAMMLEGAGFNVINLGTGVTAGQFVTAVREHQPAILGMSGLLTTTIPKMADTIKGLEAEGLRETVRVICGGAPVTQEFVDSIGADGYGPNAAAAVDLAKRVVAGKA
jgi:5-methyltetrahydrofolate--homocysteine methyltransferase